MTYVCSSECRAAIKSTTGKTISLSSSALKEYCKDVGKSSFLKLIKKLIKVYRVNFAEEKKKKIRFITSRNDKWSHPPLLLLLWHRNLFY